MFTSVRTKSGDTLWVRTGERYFLRRQIADMEFAKYENRKRIRAELKTTS